MPYMPVLLGLPIPTIRQYGPAASSVILVDGESSQVIFKNVDRALADQDTQLRLFGKPKVKTQRRMGVALALGETIEQARDKANAAAQSIDIEY